jgi:integrase
VLTILKAALNKAFQDGKVAGNEAWARVKPVRDVDAARVRYLSDDDSRWLVNGCDPGFRPMVQAALFTGCRYGELVALKVDDLDADAGTLHVRASKSGKPRHVVLTDEGRDFLAAQVAGKAKSAPLLVIAQQLGHGDTRMVEKHYGHLSTGYVADTVRAAFGTLGIAEKVTVVPLALRGGDERRRTQ